MSFLTKVGFLGGQEEIVIVHLEKVKDELCKIVSLRRELVQCNVNA